MIVITRSVTVARSHVGGRFSAARLVHDIDELYRELLALRAAIPDLRDGDLSRVHVDYDESARSLVVHRGRHLVLANLAPRTTKLPVRWRTKPVREGATTPARLEMPFCGPYHLPTTCWPAILCGKAKMPGEVAPQPMPAISSQGR